MQQLRYYILIMMAVAMLGSCSDDMEQVERDVDFCVRAVWQDGLKSNMPMRTLATNILADGTNDIDIDYADYPAIIDVHCSDGEDFIISKGTAICGEHTGYWSYCPSLFYKDKQIERDNLMFKATATIDGGDVLVSDEINKTDIRGHHILLTLHHTKALLRFAFKVDPRYDRVRYIRVTGIQLNDAECVLVDKVLTTDNQLIAYAYIDPSEVTVSNENIIRCTYNIYDKDVATDDHLTRKGVVAQNKFTLGSIKDSNGSNVSKILAGYYYDLKVTLNPDYLYVLSEHDNKHITIN